MADSRNNAASNRAFVPPWQLRSSNAQQPPPAPGLSVNGQNRAPPLPPRSNLPRQPFQSAFSSGLSSFGLPSFSAYSSPFYGSYPSPRPPGLFDGAVSSHPLLHSAFQSATPAFEGVESLVLTVRSISVMVESTYQALHSSFCVILGVADHFSKLKDHLVSILSRLSLLKLFKWILDQFLTFLRLKRRRNQDSIDKTTADWSNQFSDSATAASSLTQATTTTASRPTGSVSPHWPVVAFFGLALGAPWLLWKMVSTATTASSDTKSNAATSTESAGVTADTETSWSLGVGEHFVAKAEFDYRATAEDEISFQKDDLLKVAPKHLQRANPKGWYLASKDGHRVGLIPANHVEVLVKLEGKSRES